jgi:hypothetical protein
LSKEERGGTPYPIRSTSNQSNLTLQLARFGWLLFRKIYIHDHYSKKIIFVTPG